MITNAIIIFGGIILLVVVGDSNTCGNICQMYAQKIPALL